MLKRKNVLDYIKIKKLCHTQIQNHNKSQKITNKQILTTYKKNNVFLISESSPNI